MFLKRLWKPERKSLLPDIVILEENEPEDAYSDGVYRTTDEDEEITVEFEPEEGDNNKGFVNKVKSCFSNTLDYVQHKKNSLQNRKDFHLRERLKYYIPILDWLPQYKFLNLKGDFLAGITVGVMLVPQSLAYSILAGLPPIYALQTAFYPIIIYVLLGTSKHLSVGPEAIITILVGETLDELASTAEERASIACSLAFLVGSFTCLLGFFRFGFLAHLFSRPLLCGFINAVAFEIIMEQLDKFFGLEATKSHGFYKISIILESISEMHLLSLLMGIACLAVLLTIRFLKKRLKNSHVAIQYIPDILIVVVLSTVVTRIARLDEYGLKLLGNIEAGLLPPKFPTLLDDLNFSGLSATASSALTISMIGFVESILIATTYADKHSYTISANRELVALGMCNLVGSVLQTFPCFGSLSRSVVNDAAGARTHVAGLITGGTVLLTILLLLPLFAYLPQVALAAIIGTPITTNSTHQLPVNAALGLLEVSDIIYLWKVRARKELVLLFVTFIVTLIFGVELGIGLAIIMSLLIVIKQGVMPHIAILKQLGNTRKYKESAVIRDVSLFGEAVDWFTLSGAEADQGILMIRIEEPLYFTNIKQLQHLFQKIEFKSASPVHAIIIDTSGIPNIDASALQILGEMVEQWERRNITVCFVKLRPTFRHLMVRSGLIGIIGEDRIFTKKHEAVDFILSAHVKKHKS